MSENEIPRESELVTEDEPGTGSDLPESPCEQGDDGACNHGTEENALAAPADTLHQCSEGAGCTHGDGHVSGTKDLTSGEVAAPDESQSEDLQEEQPQDDIPQMEALDPAELAQCALCDALKLFLLNFDQALRDADFEPVAVAKERLADLKMDLGEHRGWRAVAVQSNRDVDAYLRQVMPDLQEHYGMPVDGVRQVVEDARAQKDVRDERVAAVKAILKQKASDPAMVARIRKLLE